MVKRALQIVIRVWTLRWVDCPDYPGRPDCWRRSSRGSDRWLTWELDSGYQQFLTPLLFLKCTFCPSFPLQELFKEHRLERVRCCWDHLLLNQFHCLACSELKGWDTEVCSKWRVYSQGSQAGGWENDSRISLPEGRGFGCFWDKEAGWSEVWGAWGKVIGKRCGNH